MMTITWMIYYIGSGSNLHELVDGMLHYKSGRLSKSNQTKSTQQLFKCGKNNSIRIMHLKETLKYLWSLGWICCLNT